MYLTSLALLQVLGLPQNFTFYPLNNPFSIEYQSWQCQNLPSIYTQKYLKTKCPGLIGDLNVCCAVLNECLEQETENATCLTKYSTCTTAVFSLSHPSDLVACIRFPSDVLNNFANITVQPIPQIPKLRFITNNSSGSHELLEHCPNRSRTITTCLNNFQDEVTNMKKANPNSEKSQAFASVFGVAKLRARLEMFLRSENGKKCGNGIQDFLNNLEKSVSYKNKVAKMQDESLWKCGSNLLDNYASQVILGTKCYWLKEAYNTCCKVYDKCKENFGDDTKCFKEWDNCNSGAINNGYGSIANECLPYHQWVANFEAMSSIKITEKANDSFMAMVQQQLWILIGIIIFGMILIIYSICKRRHQNREFKYKSHLEKLPLADSLSP